MESVGTAGVGVFEAEQLRGSGFGSRPGWDAFLAAVRPSGCRGGHRGGVLGDGTPAVTHQHAGRDTVDRILRSAAAVPALRQSLQRCGYIGSDATIRSVAGTARGSGRLRRSQRPNTPPWIRE